MPTQKLSNGDILFIPSPIAPFTLSGLDINLANIRIAEWTIPDVWRKSVEPTQTIYPWAMNNHWGTNYRQYQEGEVTFRYLLRPHK